jgi:hypothetical protein
VKAPSPEVLNLSAYPVDLLAGVLHRFGLTLIITPDQQAIPGSYWGDEEAGLIGSKLMARGDTPVHSILHEACHFICMDTKRREALDTDASGDYDEENAVCYLQILLSDQLPGVGRARMFHDMDAWGYSFRLGSARLWFERDAEDAAQWLLHHGLVEYQGGHASEQPVYPAGRCTALSPTWQVRNQ